MRYGGFCGTLSGPGRALGRGQPSAPRGQVSIRHARPAEPCWFDRRFCAVPGWLGLASFDRQQIWLLRRPPGVSTLRIAMSHLSSRGCHVISVWGIRAEASL